MRGLAITRTAKKHATSYPASISAGLMYNLGALGSLTPPAPKRTEQVRQSVEVN